MNRLILSFIAFLFGLHLGKRSENNEIRNLKITREEGLKIQERIRKWNLSRKKIKDDELNWDWSVPE